jgi:hypothetical protein
MIHADELFHISKNAIEQQKLKIQKEWEVNPRKDKIFEQAMEAAQSGNFTVDFKYGTPESTNIMHFQKQYEDLGYDILKHERFVSLEW